MLSPRCTSTIEFLCPRQGKKGQSQRASLAGLSVYLDTSGRRRLPQCGEGFRGAGAEPLLGQRAATEPGVGAGDACGDGALDGLGAPVLEVAQGGEGSSQVWSAATLEAMRVRAREPHRRRWGRRFVWRGRSGGGLLSGVHPRLQRAACLRGCCCCQGGPVAARCGALYRRARAHQCALPVWAAGGRVQRSGVELQLLAIGSKDGVDVEDVAFFVVACGLSVRDGLLEAVGVTFLPCF